MADSISSTSETPTPIPTPTPASTPTPTSRPQSPKGSRSPRRRNHDDDLDDEIMKGAELAPPWTAHELHSRNVYERSKTPSPPCEKYKRDKSHDEINLNIVKKRENDAQQSEKVAQHRHEHEGVVMQRAREFERKSHMECERYAKQLTEYKGRMKQREAESKPPFRNRAEQIIALGLNKKSKSRPGSPPH